MLPKDRIESLSDEISEYEYIDDDTEKWCIRDDAPDWAKKKFKELREMVEPVPDESGIITQY